MLANRFRSIALLGVLILCCATALSDEADEPNSRKLDLPTSDGSAPGIRLETLPLKKVGPHAKTNVTGRSQDSDAAPSFELLPGMDRVNVTAVREQMISNANRPKSRQLSNPMSKKFERLPTGTGVQTQGADYCLVQDSKSYQTAAHVNVGSAGIVEGGVKFSVDTEQNRKMDVLFVSSEPENNGPVCLGDKVVTNGFFSCNLTASVEVLTSHYEGVSFMGTGGSQTTKRGKLFTRGEDGKKCSFRVTLQRDANKVPTPAKMDDLTEQCRRCTEGGVEGKRMDDFMKEANSMAEQMAYKLGAGRASCQVSSDCDRGMTMWGTVGACAIRTEKNPSGKQAVYRDCMQRATLGRSCQAHPCLDGLFCVKKKVQAVSFGVTKVSEEAVCQRSDG